jgi:hypothetical protein
VEVFDTASTWDMFILILPSLGAVASNEPTVAGPDGSGYGTLEN